jgi:hypothetical protein
MAARLSGCGSTCVQRAKLVTAVRLYLTPQLPVAKRVRIAVVHLVAVCQ